MTHTAVVTHHAVAVAHPVESPPSDAWAGVLFLLVVCLMLFLMFKGRRSPAQQAKQLTIEEQQLEQLKKIRFWTMWGALSSSSRNDQ